MRLTPHLVLIMSDVNPRITYLDQRGYAHPLCTRACRAHALERRIHAQVCHTHALEGRTHALERHTHALERHTRTQVCHTHTQVGHTHTQARHTHTLGVRNQTKGIRTWLLCQVHAQRCSKCLLLLRVKMNKSVLHSTLLSPGGGTPLLTVCGPTFS